jgi:hypothetical protein
MSRSEAKNEQMACSRQPAPDFIENVNPDDFASGS